MSKEAKGFVKSNLKTIHHELSHNNRVAILAKEVSEIVDQKFPAEQQISALDIGCGDMLFLTRLRVEKMKNGKSIVSSMGKKFPLRISHLILPCFVMCYTTTRKMPRIC